MGDDGRWDDRGVTSNVYDGGMTHHLERFNNSSGEVVELPVMIDPVIPTPSSPLIRLFLFFGMTERAIRTQQDGRVVGKMAERNAEGENP